MSYQTDVNHATATNGIEALNALGIDTTTATEPLEQWDRVREATRNARTPDATELWDAVASGDQKKIDRAATVYMTARAILDAARDDPRREDTFQAATMSAIKQLVKDALPEARAHYNTAAQDYTEAFRAADNHPDPSALIVTDGGAELWADLLRAAQDMTTAVQVIKLSHRFGIKVNDQGSGLGDVVPYVTGIDDIQAVSRAKTTDWLQAREHSAHRDYAAYLLAGGTLHAGDLDEQAEEVERLIEGAMSKRTMKTIPDLKNAEERQLQRAMKRAAKKGQA